MGETLIRLHDVTKSWDGHEVLTHVDLEVRQGDFILITGPNGGGKTTLLKLLLKLTRPTAGEVSYPHHDKAHDTPLTIGYLPQKSAVDSHFPITVKEVVATALISGRCDCDKEARLEDCLKLVGLEDMAHRPLGDLSGGQVQRVLFARAIAGKPEVLVLDEPMSYLDPHYREVITSILRDMKQGGTTIIVVSHDPEWLIGLADLHLSVDRRAYHKQP